MLTVEENVWLRPKVAIFRVNGKMDSEKKGISSLVEEPGYKNVKNKHLGMSPF